MADQNPNNNEATPFKNELGRYEMLRPDGSRVPQGVRPDKYWELKDQGYTDIPKETLRSLLEQKKYENRGIAAGAAGFAGGVVPFFGPQLVKQFAPSNVDVDKLIKHNEGAYLGGEVLGTAGSLLVPAGPAGLIAKAGGAAAKGINAINATGKIAKLAKGAAAVGAAGAVEGALYGGVQELNRGVYANQDAEDIVERVISGGITGGLVGAPLGVAGKIAEKTVLAAANPVREGVTKLRNVAKAKASAEVLQSGLKDAEEMILKARAPMDEALKADLTIIDQRLAKGEIDAAKHAKLKQFYQEQHDEGIKLVLEPLERHKTDISTARHKAVVDYARERTIAGNWIGSRTTAAALAAAGTGGIVAGKIAANVIPGGHLVGAWAGEKVFQALSSDAVERVFKQFTPLEEIAGKRFDSMGGMLSAMRKEYAPKLSQTKFPRKGQNTEYLRTRLLAGEALAEKGASLLGPSGFLDRSPRVVAAAKAAYAMGKVATKGATIAAMLPDEVEAVARSVQHVDQASLTNANTIPMLIGLDLAQQQKITETVTQGIERLKQTSPIAADGSGEMSNTSRVKFTDRLVTQFDPDMAVKMLTDGKGTPEIVDQLKYSYPDIYNDLVQKAEVASAASKAGGAKYSQQQQQFISLLLTGKRVSRHAQLMQQSFRQQEEAKAKQRNIKTDLANKMRAVSDATTARLNK